MINMGFDETLKKFAVENMAVTKKVRGTKEEERHTRRLRHFAELTEMLAIIDCGLSRKQFKQLVGIDPERGDQLVAGKVFSGAIKAIPLNVFFFGPLWLLPAMFASSIGVIPGTLTSAVVATATVIGIVFSLWTFVYIGCGFATLGLGPIVCEDSTVESKNFPSFRRWQYLCERLILGRGEAEQALTEYFAHLSE